MPFGTAMGSTLQRKRKFARFTSLRKQPTLGDATTEFPAKWRLRNERRNSPLMTRHYPDLGSASDWLNQISHAAQPIWSTTQIIIISWGNKWWRREMSAVFSGYRFTCFRREDSRKYLNERIFVRDGAGPWCLHGLLFIQQKVNILEKGSIRCRLQDLLDFTY